MRRHLAVQIRDGVLWNALGQATGRALSCLTLIMLSRLLTPRDYGLWGMANLFLGSITIFAALGAGTALIQRQGDAGANASAAFYLNLVVVAFVAIFALIAAPWSGRIFGEGSVASLVRVLALSFMLRSVVSIHEAFVRKEMRYRTLQLILLSGYLAYGLSAVLLARLGQGAWSLAIGLLVSNILLAALLLIYSGTPLSWNPHLELWKGLAAFGRYLLLADVIWFWVLQADAFVVGRYLGASTLGAYVLALNYAQLPQILVGSPVADVMLPAFSRLQDQPEMLRSLLLKSMAMISLVAFPLAGVFPLIGGDLIVTLLGPQWSQAVLPFRILSCVFAALMIAAPFQALYPAANRPEVSLGLALATVPLLVISLRVGLQWGVVGIAVGVAIVRVCLTLAQLRLVSRLVRVRPIVLLRSVAAPALCALLSLGVAAAFLHAAPAPAAIARLAMTCLAFGVTYLTLITFAARNILLDIRTLLTPGSRPPVGDWSSA